MATFTVGRSEAFRKGGTAPRRAGRTVCSRVSLGAVVLLERSSRGRRRLGVSSAVTDHEDQSELQSVETGDYTSTFCSGFLRLRPLMAVSRCLLGHPPGAPWAPAPLVSSRPLRPSSTSVAVGFRSRTRTNGNFLSSGSTSERDSALRVPGSALVHGFANLARAGELLRQAGIPGSVAVLDDLVLVLSERGSKAVP